MAACELQRNYITRYCLFAIDDKDDLEMLPTSKRAGNGDLIRSTTCCIGSKASAIDGTMYVLNGNDRWVKFSKSGGGGGGGDEGPEDAEEITDQDIEDLFNH